MPKKGTKNSFPMVEGYRPKPLTKAQREALKKRLEKDEQQSDKTPRG